MSDENRPGREILQQLWNDAWAGNVWVAPWEQAVGKLTARQAAWRPAAGRHSIWQNVNHVVFWREYTLTLLAGRTKPTDEEAEVKNFCEPAGVDDAEWARTVAALRHSHERIGAAIADAANSLERLQYHLMHDAYHLGQIMLLRAMQGIPTIAV